MFREGKWARSIIEKQNPDGSWGWFHTLSKSTGDTITTEFSNGTVVTTDLEAMIVRYNGSVIELGKNKEKGES